MGKDRRYKKYNNKYDYAYTFGTFPTINMIKHKAEEIECILVNDTLDEKSLNILRDNCRKKSITLKENHDNVIDRIRSKENCNVVGVFRKFTGELERDADHLVLVNPSDMGNMGTIIRTALGFGISNIAVIRPCVDMFNPKVIRASMGAIFQINFEYFHDFSEYQERYSARDFYPFMLDGAIDLRLVEHSKHRNYSLIFGNEATGLSSSFSNIGQSIFIKHNNKIDSLNLGIAVGIGLSKFQSHDVVISS